jgi:hypothetical protein
METTIKRFAPLSQTEEIINKAFIDCTTDYFNQIYTQIGELEKKYGEPSESKVIEFLYDITHRLEDLTDEYDIDELSPEFNYVPQYDYISYDLTDSEYNTYDEWYKDMLRLEKDGVITGFEVINKSWDTLIVNFYITGTMNIPIEVFSTKMESLRKALEYFYNW